MRNNLQTAIEQQREVYQHLALPMLAQLCEIHNLSVRDIAGIFNISKSLAAEVIHYRKMPSLELAVRLARYFECSTDDLWAWMFDDDGNRRPLMIEMPPRWHKKLVRLKAGVRGHGALELVAALAEVLRQDKEG